MGGYMQTPQPNPWLPLDGVTVVDFSMFVPGPFCSAIFADLGAEVIKVEALHGDPGRGYVPVQFRTENRNKRSIAINLKAPESKAIVKKLAEKADIALEGFRPGVASRLSIDYKALAAHNPKLIYCSISGYGQTGPWRERPGHDVNYIAAAGGLSFPGQWLKPPSRSSLPVADMGGGSAAAAAVLAALYERTRTGKGVELDVSLFEAGFFWSAMRHSLNHGVDPKAHIFPVNDIFATKDGRRLTLGILEDHFWNNFVKCAESLAPDLQGAPYATDVLRRQNGDALSARLEAVLAMKTADEWVSVLEAADVPVDLCLTPAEAASLPQIVARGDVAEIAGEHGTERFAMFPVHANGRKGGSLRRPVPKAGEHTREILVELGMDDGEIAELLKSGAVKAG
jgi:crotonobetainyl-CoA:carnitine CoA-transferase CaiB-like acyl-CoA transferase